MRFLITARPADVPRPPPPAEGFERMFDAYMRFNEELSKAGVLVASEGLLPGGARAQVAVQNGERVVMDGPFAETKELVGGFYILEVPTKEEAIRWALKCPVGMVADDVLEIHQMTGWDDIPPPFRARIEQLAPTWLSMGFYKR